MKLIAESGSTRTEWALVEVISLQLFYLKRLFVMGNTIYVVNFSKNYHRNIKNNYIFVFNSKTN